MFKKIITLSLASLLLGGCSLASLTGGGAVSDQQSNIVATPTPTPNPDVELQAMPSPGGGTDTTSLETDLNNTTILDEDFSDLQ